MSDTTPIRHLILIGEIELLPRLFGAIVIPEIVFGELQAKRTPSKVKEYFNQIPDWLLIQPAPQIIDPELDEIDPGERAAILLAESLNAEGIIIDDLAGRKVANERGLRVLGTLGLLESAGQMGLVDFNNALDRLIDGGFYISRALEDDLRSRNDR